VSGGMSLMYEPHSFIHGRTDRQTDKPDGQDGWTYGKSSALNFCDLFTILVRSARLVKASA